MKVTKKRTKFFLLLFFFFVFSVIGTGAIAEETDSRGKFLINSPKNPPIPPPLIERKKLKTTDTILSTVLAVDEDGNKIFTASLWKDGCTPTASKMVLDLLSFGALTEEVRAKTKISSGEHYADYSLPIETGHLLADNSEADWAVNGVAHQPNCLADYMETSKSISGLSYGWTYTNMIGIGLPQYVKSITDSKWKVEVISYHFFSEFRDIVCREIDAGKPLLASVYIEGDGHTIAIVGYNTFNDEYICFDTWYQNMRYVKFESSILYNFSLRSIETVTVIPISTPKPPNPEEKSKSPHFLSGVIYPLLLNKK